MLQKTGNIILALLILCTTTGIVVNKHFSDGELYSVSLYGEAESCCGGDFDSMNTCHDESAVYQVKDYFRTSTSFSIQGQLIYYIHFNHSDELFQIQRKENISIFPEYKLTKPKIPKLLLLQVFIL
jgi:hypothetical protein